MKICIVSSSVFAIGSGGLSGYGGLEQLAWQQADGLARKGHEVALVAPDGSRLDNGTVIPCGPAGQWNERMSFTRYKEALPNFDVIIDNSWMKNSYLMKMEGRLKAPVLGVCHAPVSGMFQSLPPIENPCFVCISQDQANHFEALFSRKARVCYNGINLETYRPMTIPRTDRFLFLARFSSVKSPDITIEACKQAGVGLDLVGDTSITNEPQLLEKCKQMADGKQIRLVGPAKRGECVYWYSQAHAFLHVTPNFREPMGLAPVEAQACGLPVVCWRHGALKETVLHGETGWAVSSMSDLVDAIRDVQISEQMRRRCREWVASKFDVNMMVSRYEKLCIEALDNGGW